MTCRTEGGDTTVGKAIASHAMRRPNAPAIVCPNLELLSFGDLARHVQLIGNQLRTAGVGSNSRIGIALPRGPAAALLSIAACCNGILVPLNPSLSNTDLEAELTHLRLDALIVSDIFDLHKWSSLAGEECGLFTVAETTPSRFVGHCARTDTTHWPAQTGPATDRTFLGLYLPDIRDDGHLQARAGDPQKFARDGGQNAVLAAADTCRPLRLHHADRLQCGLQSDAVGAAADRMQCRPARIDTTARLRAMAKRAAAHLADCGSPIPAGGSRETSCAGTRKGQPRLSHLRCVSCFRRRPTCRHQLAPSSKIGWVCRS